MQNGDEALSSIILTGRGLLVKMLITFELHKYMFWILHTYTFILNWQGKWKRNEEKNYWSRLDSNHWTSGCWITRKPLRSLGHHVLNTTLEQFTYIPFTWARQIKSARPLHDPGTGYWLVFVHHGSCTLQSVDSLFTIAPICDCSLFCYAVLFKCPFYLVGEERADCFTLPSWCLVTVSEWWLSGWSSVCDCGIS